MTEEEIKAHIKACAGEPIKPKRKHIATGRPRGHPYVTPEIDLTEAKPKFTEISTRWIDPSWEVRITLSIKPDGTAIPETFSWFMNDDQLRQFEFDVIAGELGKITYSVNAIQREVA